MNQKVILLAMVFLFPASCLKEKEGQITKEEIKIGNQIWMAKNLDIFTEESCCSELCNLHGRLYTWYEAVELADQMEGWRLPTLADWRTLEKFLGSGDEEDKLSNRTGGSELKKIPSFNVFPGSCMKGEIVKLNEQACYWARDTVRATSNGKLYAYTKTLFNQPGNPKIDQIYESITSLSAKKSVRLIKE